VLLCRALAQNSLTVFWPELVMTAVVANTMSIKLLLHANSGKAEKTATETALMLSAQTQGLACFWLTALAALPGLAILLLTDSNMNVYAGILPTMVLLSLLSAITLPTALLKYYPAALQWRAADWIIPVHHALFESGRWQWLARGTAMCMAGIAVAALTVGPTQRQPQVPQGPVNIFANSEADAMATIEKLKAIPSAEAVRWLGMFLPADADDKRAALKQLRGQFHRIAPVSGAVPDELKDQVDAMQESLKSVASATTARPQLKQAADTFRRSLALLSATGDARQLLQLENRLFGGFNRLADRADILAGLEPQRLEDLPSELHRMFGVPPGPFRIEISPVQGVSDAALAISLQNAGITVTHQAALAQRTESLMHQAFLRYALGLSFAAVLMFFLASDLRGLGATVLPAAGALLVLIALETFWPAEWTVSKLLELACALSVLMMTLYLAPSNRTSTALSAMKILLQPLLAFLLAAPFALLNVEGIPSAFLPLAVALFATTLIIGLMQRHRAPEGEQD